jgi:predicted N-acetyltransferase YhbS
MTIDVRTFDGDVQSFAEYVVSGWRKSYGETSIVPLWTVDYFKWQLPRLMAGNFDEVIAAYDGAKLVGVLAFETVPVRLMGEDTTARLPSWLTVDTEYRRKGIGRLLWEAIVKAAEASFNCGFINIRRTRQFWTRTTKIHIFPRPRTWVRVLDAGAVAKGVMSRRDALLCYAGQWAAAPFPIGAPDTDIHPYEADDLDACHALFERHMSHYDLAYRWDRARLAHHLGYGDPARTLVLRTQGKVAGFINFHVLDLMGRGALRTAMVNTLAPYDMPFAHARALMRAALAAMKRVNVGIGEILGPPTNPASVLLSSGFMPEPFAASRFTAVQTPDCPALAKVQRVYGHFR